MNQFESMFAVAASLATIAVAIEKFLGWTSVALKPVLVYESSSKSVVEIYKRKEQVAQVYSSYKKDLDPEYGFGPNAIFMGIRVEVYQRGNRNVVIDDIQLLGSRGVLLDKYSSYHTASMEVAKGRKSTWISFFPQDMLESDPSNILQNATPVRAVVQLGSGHRIKTFKTVSKKLLAEFMTCVHEQQIGN